ncbi:MULTISPECIES: hypothetical protein [unclassified Mesorhizobium]|uniref:hypothetical protein n=1 Tax=unclassified Mesorhizobium TaxID=325217 RepID=UPI00095D08DE|nr:MULTISPECIES: hypothetical protein [unclassified Mesorhizobium]MBN9253918.1 hypothetical protein [Mesorhizobium sp.]OJX73562.1 MAG: hypothetical protein BGO93_13805 [Mesorhizobium sp. 65-26]
MADFVSVLKKQLEKKGDPSFEVRKQIYDGARAVLAKKLADYSPPLPADVITKQKRSLEDAIASVERDYAKPVAKPAPEVDPLAELEHIFSSIDRNKNQPSHVRQPLGPLPGTPDPLKPKAASEPVRSPLARPEPARPPLAKSEPARPPLARSEPAMPPLTKPEPARPASPAARNEPSWQRPAPPPSAPTRSPPPLVGMDQAEPDDQLDDLPGNDEPASDTFERLRPAKRKRGYGGLIAAVVALLVLAGGGYGLWLNKDALSGMFASKQTSTAKIEPLKQTPTKPAANGTAPATATPGSEGEGSKFTQRLSPEGKETDPGPAGGQSTVGEGESVAALTTPPPTPAAPAAQQPAPAGATPAPAAPAPATPATPETNPATPPAAGTAGAAAPAGATPATPPAEATVPVGQKAIFYEERTNSSQGSAEPGSIVWSLVQESPGGDLPPEPAIRAEATIPGKDIQLRMTIRRNTDQTLPASHIIEMIFLTPEGFEGGGVDNILRIAMKGSEQDAGSPLIGIPAKIADGFFLVALNDTKADKDANLTLLRSQDWIDVPVVYKSGRRALLTMEKGIPGEKVFDDALKAWATKTSG